MTVQWNLFDPNADSRVTRRNLPHIDMPGALTFVTFRLGDSMPRHIVDQWHKEIDVWLTENNLQGRTVEEVLSSPNVDTQLKSELRTFKQRRWHGHLDDCHGACVLKDASTRKHLEESLLHFDDERYDLERFVIMPNHAHVLLQMRQGFDLRKQFAATLRYSARQINQHLVRSGDLWQSEPFDHVVRSEAQFEYLQQYIVDNPKKANLKSHEYTLWICK